METKDAPRDGRKVLVYPKDGEEAVACCVNGPVSQRWVPTHSRGAVGLRDDALLGWRPLPTQSAWKPISKAFVHDLARFLNSINGGSETEVIEDA